MLHRLERKATWAVHHTNGPPCLAAQRTVEALPRPSSVRISFHAHSFCKHTLPCPPVFCAGISTGELDREHLECRRLCLSVCLACEALVRVAVCENVERRLSTVWWLGHVRGVVPRSCTQASLTHIVLQRNQAAPWRRHPKARARRQKKVCARAHILNGPVVCVAWISGLF